MKINPSVLKRAAYLLDAQADALHTKHADPTGGWPKNSRVHRDHFFELRKVARDLRDMAQQE